MESPRRGALAAAESAANTADSLLHRSGLPASFKNWEFGPAEVAASIRARIRLVDALLDIAEGTDRRAQT